MEILVIFAGLATGIVLGLFGSGGSIIALPALLYLLQVEPKSAIAMSLGVVAITAAIAAIDHWRCGNVVPRVALIFSLFGMLGTFAGARLGLLTPVSIQLALFALTMLVAAWRMLRPVPVPAGTATATMMLGDGTAALSGARTALLPDMRHVAVHGIGVGVLTGVVGVGGGFLIVPALVLLSGIPMRQAIGTSLVVIAAKSSAGFAGYLSAVPIDFALMAEFAGVTVAGSFIGTRLSNRVPQPLLRKAFVVFLLVIASYILLKSVVGG